MPQPAGPQDTEAFVGRSGELAVLRAALRQAAAGDAPAGAGDGRAGHREDRAGPRLRPGGRGRRRAGAVGQRVGGRRRPALLALGAGAAQLRPAGRGGGARPRGRPAGRPAGPAAPRARRPPGSSPASGRTRARFALFDAVCAVLDQASRSAPLVVVLDDLHARAARRRCCCGSRRPRGCPGSCWSPPTAPRRRRWTRRSAT